MEEMLLARGPYKWLTTIPADKLLIGIFHGANLPQSGRAGTDVPHKTACPEFRERCTNFYRIFGAISLAKLG
jgi:hypothetical protein